MSEQFDRNAVWCRTPAENHSARARAQTAANVAQTEANRRRYERDRRVLRWVALGVAAVVLGVVVVVASWGGGGSAETEDISRVELAQRGPA